MSVEHVVKCWPNYFEATKRGEKSFEIRRDDRGYQKGDILCLEKYNPETNSYEMEFKPGDSRRSRKTVRKLITFILTGGQFGIAPGYVILGLSDAPPCVTGEDHLTVIAAAFGGFP